MNGLDIENYTQVACTPFQKLAPSFVICCDSIHSLWLNFQFLVGLFVQPLKWQLQAYQQVKNRLTKQFQNDVIFCLFVYQQFFAFHWQFQNVACNIKHLKNVWVALWWQFWHFSMAKSALEMWNQNLQKKFVNFSQMIALSTTLKNSEFSKFG